MALNQEQQLVANQLRDMHIEDEAAYCPIPNCGYSGPLLHDHIRDAHASAAVAFSGETTVTLHSSMPFRVLLHEPDGRVLLVLNDASSVRKLALLCIGPPPAADRALDYTIVVRAVGGPEVVSVKGPVPCTRRWLGPDHHQAGYFTLLVPNNEVWIPNGSVSVTVHVGRVPIGSP